MTATPTQRQPLPDALRALALVAVLAVNAAGYLVAPWGALLGERQPADSVVASTVQGCIAALLQGKGFPMLAFLFGMGLWLATRGRDAAQAQQRGVARQKKLLGLGVVHGVFIYFGDILTLYALIGWHLLPHVREPWHLLRQRLRRALWWAAGAMLLPLVVLGLMVSMGSTATSAAGRGPADTVAAPPPTADAAPRADTDHDSGQASAAAEPDLRLSQARRAADFLWINVSAYAALQIFSLPLLWPLLRLCMLCGVAAARLRLLTHRRWRHSLLRWTQRLAPPLLLLNLGYGLATVQVSAASQRAYVLEVFAGFIGPPLAAVYIIVLALAAHGGRARWCQWLAPLGARSLSLYVAHGVLCAWLFTGLGLGLQPGTLHMALFSLGLWCLALLLAHASGRKRWPLEAWMGRR